MDIIPFLRYLAVMSVLASASAAEAQSSPSQTPSIALRSCRQQVLRSAGYRDMLARFPVRQRASDFDRAARLRTSYRDASERHPTALPTRSSLSSRLTLRYELKPATKCL